MENNGANNANHGKERAFLVDDFPEPKTLTRKQFAELWAAAQMQHKRRQAALRKRTKEDSADKSEGSSSTTGR